MIRNNNQTILVVNDIEATCKSIKVLLAHDGYHIEMARDEQTAADAARFKQPDLILVSLDGKTDDVIESVRHIRERAALDENVPIIIVATPRLRKKEIAVCKMSFFLP
jgi:DNA-binding response OmpR family regulator